jgi:hypothetical protein
MNADKKKQRTKVLFYQRSSAFISGQYFSVVSQQAAGLGL